MTDIVVGGILLVILAAAISYIVKAKKAGVKCVGCPEGCSCSAKNDGGSSSGCGCGCHSEMK
ncbi:MAG: FeoB-associated Cys-rich membrane protein [Firmicutes bacterium]|nr:FeoB-associated Cys-rich membrane protein [Bacillota bacterium]